MFVIQWLWLIETNLWFYDGFHYYYYYYDDNASVLDINCFDAL